VALLTILLAGFSVSMEYPRKLVEMMLAQPEIGFSEVTALAGLPIPSSWCDRDRYYSAVLSSFRS
jgi:hypothetical protein